MANILDDPQALFTLLQQNAVAAAGDWSPSPVMQGGYALLNNYFSPDYLINFKRTPLALGEQNWPDYPEENYTGSKRGEAWMAGLTPNEKKMGFLRLAEMLLTAYRMHSENHLTYNQDHYTDQKVGNPCLYEIAEVGTFSEASIRYAYWSVRIWMQLKLRNPDLPINTILEIGGGFGGLCAKILKIIPATRYIIVELPANLITSYYFLSNLFDKVQLIYEETDLNKLNGEGIFILAPWLLEKTDLRLDLALNTMSFQHMSKDNLNYYFRLIEKFKTKYIYFINRNWLRDPSDIIIDHYPIPEHYRFISRGPCRFWPKHEECFLESNQT